MTTTHTTAGPAVSLVDQIGRAIRQADTPDTAVAAVCQLVADTVNERLDGLARYHHHLATQYGVAGNGDLAREHAIRAATHREAAEAATALLAAHTTPTNPGANQ